MMEKVMAKEQDIEKRWKGIPYLFNKGHDISLDSNID